MNRSKIKNYAPKARQDFIQAVMSRAAFYGMKEEDGKLVVQPLEKKGDSVLIRGQVFPSAVSDKRRRLEERIRQHGFSQTIEALAYTWFNRLVAIRFMELHGYLNHGYRVLSHPEGKPTTEIIEHAEHVDLPGLDKQKVIELKIDGTRDAELYRLLLIAQCNALHSAMPFLFERIEDETELVLPDNLLHSDSLIRNLVNDIDEEDWQEVEIIGWLYESYISERYEAVIGKVVASEDIPAATQRFTPKWIVRYLVQNTLGRMWLATYPTSALREQMKYYIEPAEQTPEVQEQLKAITPASLNPEEITFLDPACGSGHILVEAYDLFRTIYQERGYRAKDIPALILGKNLFGLEIDDRAAQLAAFALMMKARADDRRIFDGGVQPNVLAIQESKGLNARDIAEALNAPILSETLPPSQYLMEEFEEADNPLFTRKTLAVQGKVAQIDVASLLELFEDAKTFGSLIQIPQKLAVKLPDIEQRVKDVLRHGDLTNASAGALLPLLHQACLMSRRYDIVVANPPYMGGKYFTGRLKEFVADNFKDAKADLYACFIQRSFALAKTNGFVGMITIPNWMFLSSFEEVRKSLFDNQTIDTFIHNGRGVFGSDFGSCSFVLRNNSLPAYRGSFRKLFDKQSSVTNNEELERRILQAPSYLAAPEDFRKLPGEVIAYSATPTARDSFATNRCLSGFAEPRQGLATSDDGRFVRLWHEVGIHKMCLVARSREEAKQSGKKWFPFNKGGPFRRWYGNLVHVVNWEQDGRELLAYATELYKSPTRTIKNMPYYFRSGITWSNVTISSASFRQFDAGTIISHVGPGIFLNDGKLISVLGYVNSAVANRFLELLSPTAHFEVGQIQNLPYREHIADDQHAAKQAVELARTDWNSFEVAWGFQSLPILQHPLSFTQQSQEAVDVEQERRFQRMKELEEENNRLFIKVYGLQDELAPEVPDEQITLSRPNREEDIKRLLSYALGCIMGRYSLDRPGLVYADAANIGFDPGQYKTFQADEDGILPLTETDWGFQDDTARRIEEFIAVAWPKEHLVENLKFIGESLGPAKNEQPRDTIRRYLATGFYKDHLRWYKRRPIYWLFSSGKERAFQCLVYLHRYHEGTLARMRTQFVIPLQGRIASRIEQLEGDKAKATSTSHGKKIQKEQDALRKQQAELLAFDEKLKHFADMKIKLDLDDGVKVNYAKFGDLVAEVKAITGGKDEE